jgi:hypothetical protein
MSRPCQSAGKSTEQSHTCVLASAAKLVGENVVDGQQQLDALGLRLVERGLGHVDLVFFDQDLPVFTPSARWKVYAMPPTITSVSTLSSRFSMTSILPEILEPPMMATKGFSGDSSALPR